MIDLRDNMGKYISVAWRHMAAYMGKRMEPLNIGVGQYPFLFSLYIEDGQSQQSLSDKLLLNKAATARAINKLEETGYVKRQLDESDKRSYHIFLTDKGKSIKPDLEVIVEEVQEILLEGMTNEEKFILKRLMQQMAANIIRATRGK